METFKSDIFNGLVISMIFLVIFAIAEIWRKAGSAEAEYTRKFVHLSSGVVCLSFGWVFHSHWTVLILCLLFISIIVVTQKMHWLNSVHGVERQSRGGIYFPLSIYLTFLIASLGQRPDFYFIAILTLAVSDSLAAVVGTSYGKKFYDVEDHQRTLEGTVVFFLITFIIVHLCLLFLTDLSRLETVLSALYIAMLVTAFESISLGGSDNFYIPIGTIAILLKFTVQGEPEMIKQISVMLATFVIVYFLLKKKNVKVSGITGLALICYGAYALIDFSWAYLILLTIVVYSLSSIPAEYVDSKHGIRNIFYLSINAFFWVLVANYSGLEYSHFFLPFAISVTSIMSVLINYQLYLNAQEKMPLSLLLPVNKFFRPLIVSAVFLAPYFIFYIPEPAVIFLLLGILVPALVVRTYHYFQKYGNKMSGKVRILAVVILLFSAISFVIEDYFYNINSIVDSLFHFN